MSYSKGKSRITTNGTAVILGRDDPEASKPVKWKVRVFYFKIFADIDVFDIEINEKIHISS